MWCEVGGCAVLECGLRSVGVWGCGVRSVGVWCEVSVCAVCRQALLDQEHRDRELALRLAMEDQNAVEDISLPPPLPR